MYTHYTAFLQQALEREEESDIALYLTEGLPQGQPCVCDSAVLGPS